jgi:hypothetical protein
MLLLLALSCSAGCTASPNLLTLTNNGIRAQGTISYKGERIEEIDIYPDKLVSDKGRQLWVSFSSGKEMTLQNITEQMMQALATPASSYYPQYYSVHENHDYYIDGYNFQFKNGRLIKLSINLYGWPPRDRIAFVNIGRSNGPSVKLPCSVSDFEKVFGKANIARAYYE